MSESWQVVGQRQSTVRNASGQFEDAMIVTVKTGKGNTFNLTIPMSQYTPANVHALIDAQAAQVDAVSSLTASQPPSSPEPSQG